nr:MAG TPA: hypothetical protein [Caudoviricetes sp.]
MPYVPPYTIYIAKIMQNIVLNKISKANVKCLTPNEL